MMEFMRKVINLQGNISVYPVNVSGAKDMKELCGRIGTDPGALSYLIPKSKMLHFYAEHIDYRAAGFLKQEMLSRGGDVAVAKHVIDGRTDYSDILIMGTASQFRRLIEKMKAMDIWGIKDLREALTEALRNVNARHWEMTSPAGHTITLGHDTKLMAILNLTPDSFHAPSRTDDRGILGRAEEFLSEGAYILDVGAESTRPGAEAVSESEEAERLLPALRVLRREFPDAIISVDTYKGEIARLAALEGADIINDIGGFGLDAGMLGAVAELNMPYVLSHIKGTPQNMAGLEGSPDIVGEVNRYFSGKLAALEEAGLKRENVIIDPGLGFGKSSGDNFAILKDIESLRVFGRPVLVGHSRKRFTGTDRLSGTLAVSAVLAGRVSLLRVHDVRENVEALRVAEGVRNG